MATFTCINCSVAFKDADLQRDHYRSDWHRYNLKRKIAELPPVSLAQFNSKLEKQKQAVSQEKKGPASSSGYCVACSKNFSTEKAYVNHVKSKKHLEAMTAFDKKEINREELEMNRKNRKMALDEKRKEEQEAMMVDDEEDDDEDWEDDSDDDSEETVDEEDEFEGEPVAVTDCLFCTHHSSNLERNVLHMTSEHSFFLPDAEFIVDLEGLIEYLGAKVGQGHVCLWCNDKSKRFRDVTAVQKHMDSKGHRKILHDSSTLAEFAEFYDYSSSYPEGHKENGSDGEEEGGVDAEVDVDQLDDAGYELTLPSGARVGHRSLMRYYRQGVAAERSVVVHKSMNSVLGHYKSFGWVGMTSAEAKKKATDLKFMKRVQQKSWMKLGTKANKLQKHWRDPTMGF